MPGPAPTRACRPERLDRHLHGTCPQRGDRRSSQHTASLSGLSHRCRKTISSNTGHVRPDRASGACVLVPTHCRPRRREGGSAATDRYQPGERWFAQIVTELIRVRDSMGAPGSGLGSSYPSPAPQSRVGSRESGVGDYSLGAKIPFAPALSPPVDRSPSGGCSSHNSLDSVHAR